MTDKENKFININQNELKECPFCGNIPKVKIVGNSYLGCEKVNIKCPHCCIEKTQSFITRKYDYEFIKEAMLRHWNNRVN